MMSERYIKKEGKRHLNNLAAIQCPAVIKEELFIPF
jgi:hypothetical protein